MVTKDDAVRLAQQFVENELGYDLELLNSQHVTPEMLRERLARASLAAKEAEAAKILAEHQNYWAVVFVMRLPDGTTLDSPAVVRVEERNAIASWLAESSSLVIR